MKYEDYIQELKSCVTQKEVWNLMSGKEYDTLNGTRFEDNKIFLCTTTTQFSSRNVQLGGIYELAFRVILYLKIDGEIGNLRFGAGQQNYFSELHSILEDLSKIYGEINSLSDISPDGVETIITKFRQESSASIFVLVKRLKKLHEWILYGNDKLPIFLRLNPQLLKASEMYKKLLFDYRNEKRKEKLVGSTREIYPFHEFKILVSEAINYLSLYSEDCLIALQLLIDIRDMTDPLGYTYLYDYFRKTSYTFTEPLLKKLQHDFKKVKTKHRLIDGKNTGRSVLQAKRRCLEPTKRLEEACIIIIFMTTGMRAQELYRLERYPLITEDEHYNLKRLVYKTASSKHGHELWIPIPEITKFAIEILSKISEIKEEKSEGMIIVSDIYHPDGKRVEDRLNAMLKKFSKYVGVKKPPTVHQFRHAIAFLIVHLNEKNGLELARMFLGHDSIVMTLRYMGKYNSMIEDALKILREDESKQLVGELIKEVKDGKKLYGPQGERLMNDYCFTGSCVDKFTDVLNKSLMRLIEKGQYVIIQSSICFCIHDLTDPKGMECQRGFGIEDFMGEEPVASRCEGGRCRNSLFTENKIEELKENIDVNPEIPEELQERLMQNTYFVDFDGFESFLDPHKKIIEKYNNDQEVKNGKAI